MAMTELATLTEPGIMVHPLGIEFTDDFQIESWARLGPLLKRSGIVAQWRLADWLAFAIRKSKEEAPSVNGKSDRKWTDALKAYKESQRHAEQTIWKLAYVARSFPVERRRETVESMSVYEELAALKPQQQTAWLDRVETEHLPISQLRRLLRTRKATEKWEKDADKIWDSATVKCRELLTWLKSRPEEFWTPERKCAWAAELKPLAEFYAGLVS